MASEPSILSRVWDTILSHARLKAVAVLLLIATMGNPRRTSIDGPFRAEHVRQGDPYELSDGHAIRVLPTAGRGASAIRRGAFVLGSDPTAKESGVDAGYSPSPGTLRAPDISVGNVPEEPGWIPGAPPLAVEYADTGQDEAALESKIADLLQAGTRFVWVVRLTGVRRVEVHEPGKSVRTVLPGQQLIAPGILQHPVLVEELYDEDASMEAALRNLLNRKGYAGLDAVRAESKEQGRAEGKVEGRAEGKVEGRAEGKVEGRAEGKAEGLEQAKQSVARNMLAAGMNEETIAQILEVNLETVRRLVAATTESAQGKRPEE